MRTLGTGLEVGTVWIDVLPSLKNFNSVLTEELRKSSGTQAAGQAIGKELSSGIAKGMGGTTTGSSNPATKMYSSLTAGMKQGNDNIARESARTGVIMNGSAEEIAAAIKQMLVAMGRAPAEIDTVMRQMAMSYQRGGAEGITALRSMFTEVETAFSQYNSMLKQQAATTNRTIAETGASAAKLPGTYFSGLKGFLGSALIPISPAFGMAAFLGGPWAAAGAGVGMALAGGVGLGFQAGIKQQMSNIQFDTLLGPAADKWQQAVIGFAQKTPFQLDQLRSSFTGLVAAGMDVEKILPVMHGLGDTLSAMGMATTDGLDRAVYAIKQIIAAGVLRMTEVRQLTELNIPVVQELAVQLDKTTGQITTMISEGKISSDVLVNAFINPMGPLKQFTGLMKEANATFTVAVSNFKDALTVSFGNAFIPVLESAAKLLRDMTPLLQPLGEAFAGLIQPFIDAFGKAVPLIGQAIKAIAPVISGLGQALGPIFGAFLTLLPVIGKAIASILTPILTIVQSVAPVIAQWITAFIPFINQAGVILTQVAMAVGPIVDLLAQNLLANMAVFLPMLHQILPIISQLVAQILPILIQVLTPLLNAFYELERQALPALMPLIVAFMGTLSSLVPVLTLLVPVAQYFAFTLTVWAQVLGALAPAIQFVTDLLYRGMNGAIMVVLRTLADFIHGLHATLSAINTVIQHTYGIPNSVKDSMQGAVDAIGGAEGDLYAASDSAGAAMVNGLAAYQPMMAVTGQQLGATVASAFLAAVAATPMGLGMTIGSAVGLTSSSLAVPPVMSTAPAGSGGTGGDSGSKTGGSKAAKPAPEKPSFNSLISLPFLAQSQQQALRDSIHTFMQDAIHELKKFDDYNKKFVAHLKAEGRDLLKYSADWTQLTEKIQIATAMSDKLKDFASPVNALRQGYNSAAGVQRRETDLLQETKAFAQNLKEMRAKGASGALIADILNAGVETGNQMMEALLSGSNQQDRRAINNIDHTMKKTARVSEKVGLFAANSAQQLGTDMAGGIIKGLESRQAELEKVMKHLAQSMTHQVKKELGIKSPSRVFAEIGGHVGDGLAAGIIGKHGDVQAALSAAVPHNIHVPGVGSIRASDLGQPVVNVWLGDEKLSELIDYRVERGNRKAVGALTGYHGG